ncbi:MAG: sigma-70 family RNA polymerase sigma factor [Acidobacteria bacterium]|jgi:RNA polymerase sigma-70 factor (ECF subfamily)|nr:sigma-70 family RNA polymerase sigma factor [Acidobacteriota bacterium]
MSDELVGTVTRLLHDYRPDDPASGQRLFEAIYPELRRVAGGLMRHERPNHTMQATELVHDAFVRLVDQTVLRDADRPRFLGIAARAMRQILVDHARSRGAEKRGAGLERVTLDDALAQHGLDAENLLALDAAMESLAAREPRAARVVELKVFGGLTAQEIGGLLDVSKRTVDGDWALARLWITRALRG